MTLNKEIIRYHWQHLYDTPYTKRFANIRPLVTIYYLNTQYEQDGVHIPETYVGLAICNQKDNPSKWRGRNISSDRALEYFIIGKQDPIRSKEALETLYAVDLPVESLKDDGYLFHAFRVDNWTFNLGKWRSE